MENSALDLRSWVDICGIKLSSTQEIGFAHQSKQLTEQYELHEVKPPALSMPGYDHSGQTATKMKADVCADVHSHFCRRMRLGLGTVAA